MESTKVAGVPLTIIKKVELMDQLKKAIKENRQLSLVAVNARKIVKTVRDAKMRMIMDSFDIRYADGTAVVKAAEVPLERITGIDLLTDICRESDKMGARLFFYGAEEESNVQAQKNLRKQFPKIQIAGYCNGYEDGDVLTKIKDSGANVLFVAKGTPLQEEWIIEHKKSLDVNILMGVGGALDIWSGKTKRAPEYVQRAGMEWLYRMIREPGRFAQLPELFAFHAMIRREKR